MKFQHFSLSLLALTTLSLNTTAFATTITMDVEGTNGAEVSGPLTTGTAYKTNAGTVTLSSTSNAIGLLEINGGEVVVSSASNLNGASSSVKFNASGTDPVLGSANAAKLHIADDMNTGILNFATDGEVEVHTGKTATWNVVPTGSGLVAKSGDGVLEVASDLSAATTLAGIHVDAGTLYLQSGKTPNAAIQVASGAKLQLDGVSGGADSEVKSAVTIQAGGSIDVDAGVKVGDVITTTTTYNFNTDTGYFESGADQLPWSSNFTAFDSGETGLSDHLPFGPNSNWWTNDTTNQNVSYGGITLNFWSSDGSFTGPNGETHTYFNSDSTLSAAHPTSTVTTDNDAALSGTVLMESGSKIVLGDGANWARDITVGTAS